MRVMITIESVRELFINSNDFKSTGPDKIHFRMLKKLAQGILKPLAIICTVSQEMGKKRANIVPIFQKGA